MVYMWKDSAGNTHYANKEYDIPARYKSKTKVLYPDAADTVQTQPGNQNEQPRPEMQQPIASQQPTPQEQQKEKAIVTMPTENRAMPVKTGRRQRRSATEE